MSDWKTPVIVEIPAGMEIGAYAPAEMDGPPFVRNVGPAPLPSRAATVRPPVTAADPQVAPYA